MSLPSADLLFIRNVLVDLMYLDGRPVLQVVDKDTCFSAVCFLDDGEAAEAVWHRYVRI